MYFLCWLTDISDGCYQSARFSVLSTGQMDRNVQISSLLFDWWVNQIYHHLAYLSSYTGGRCQFRALIMTKIFAEWDILEL